jgi:hypothetical protein
VRIFRRSMARQPTVGEVSSSHRGFGSRGAAIEGLRAGAAAVDGSSLTGTAGRLQPRQVSSLRTSFAVCTRL